MAIKRPACAVCKAPGHWVELVGKTRVGACKKHDKAIRIGTSVTGAALKAGIIAGMEMARPGLFEQVQKAFWTVKEVIASVRAPAAPTDE